MSEAFFSYYLLFAIGINNLINFVFHVFFGDVAAKFIGWENSPFQAEVAQFLPGKRCRSLVEPHIHSARYVCVLLQISSGDEGHCHREIDRH